MSHCYTLLSPIETHNLEWLIFVRRLFLGMFRGIQMLFSLWYWNLNILVVVFIYFLFFLGPERNRDANVITVKSASLHTKCILPSNYFQLNQFVVDFFTGNSESFELRDQLQAKLKSSKGKAINQTRDKWGSGCGESRFLLTFILGFRENEIEAMA